MAPSFLFYDYEAHGKDALCARPASFAALRTDENLNLIGEPVHLFCRLANDFLPSPFASCVHKLSVAQLQKDGLVEAEFARAVYEAMMQPGTINTGFCSHNYDRKVTHSLFHRNLLPLYGWHQSPNATFDIYGLLCLTANLAPGELRFGKTTQGRPSSKLLHLSKANGISHHAHDALSDVHATLELTRRAKQALPEVFEYVLQLCKKQIVQQELTLSEPRIFLHASGIYSHSGYMAPVLPVTLLHDQSGKPDCVVILNLVESSELLFTLSAAEIRQAVLQNESGFSRSSRLPLSVVALNSSPALFPKDRLTKQQMDSLSIDWAVCEEGMNQFFRLRGKLEEAFCGHSRLFPTEFSSDVDDQIYQKFPTEYESSELVRLQQLSPREVAQDSSALVRASDKYRRLYFRFIARNYPEFLSHQHLEQWDQFRLELLQGEKARKGLTYSAFKKELMDARMTYRETADIVLLDELETYAEALLQPKVLIS